MATIFFTGFPGFLGTVLVARLLAHYPEDVHIACLVQPAYRKLAEARVAAIKVQQLAHASRVHLHDGDITQADLGLGETYTSLARDVIEIFHLAAVYDLGVPRDMAVKINIDGTRHMLDFARKCPNLRRFQYMSTAYVCGQYPGLFTERDLVRQQPFNNFYEETKYAAELAVQQHMQNGLQGIIYRPSIIVGDSKTGATQKYDSVYYYFQWLLRQPKALAILPMVSNPTKYTVNFVPRDFVVDAVVHLGSQDSSIGKVYHLIDPAPPTVDEAAAILAQATERRVFRVLLPAQVSKWALNHVPGFQKFMRIEPATIDYFTLPTAFSCDNVLNDLSGTDIHCPPFASYAGTLVAFMKAHPEFSSDAMI